HLLLVVSLTYTAVRGPASVVRPAHRGPSQPGHSQSRYTTCPFENAKGLPGPRTAPLKPPGSLSLPSFALTPMFVGVVVTARWSKMEPTEKESSATPASTHRKGNGL